MPTETTRVIALDGPSGSGKSTVARALARRLGWRYHDTGATYRAATLAVLRSGTDLDDADAVALTVADARISVSTDPDLPGTACNYVHNGLFLAGKTSRFGLNNFIQYVDCGLTTSVHDVPSPRNELFVHADPGSGSITIGGTALAPGTVVGLRVTDAAGRIALTVPRMSGSTFNAAGLPAGVYVATVLNERNERIASRSFVWFP